MGQYVRYRFLSVIAAVAMMSPAVAVQVSAAAARPAIEVTRSCQQVLFVGARGSGEYGPGSDHWPKGRDPKDPHGLGGPVDSAYLRLIKDFADRRLVQVVSVPYPAARVTTLLHDPRRYFRGIAGAVTWTERYLTSQARACRAQRIVLAGFSEGAMVMHRVLHQLGGLASGRRILGRLAAAILVGDGDQVPRDSQARFGTAVLNARGVGQAFRTISRTSKATFSPVVGSRVLSVCNRHDIVCGWTDTNISACLVFGKFCPVLVTTMVKIHLSYPGSKPLLAAADRAAAEAAGWDVVRPPAPAGAPAGGQADVAAVACRTATRCVAVGGYGLQTKESNASYPMVENWSGSSWTGTAVPLPANAGQPASGFLTSVTCPSATKCVAIGQYFDDAGDNEGLIVTGSGTQWKAAEAPLPGNAMRSPIGDIGLAAVACGSATSCVIVGGYLDDDVITDGLLISEGRRHWAAVEMPVPADARPDCSGLCDRSGAQAVACPKPQSCVVVASYASPDTFRSLMLTGYGSRWTEVKAADPTTGHVIHTLLAAVGCPARARCEAPGTFSGSAVVESGFGTSWRLAATPLPRGAQRPAAESIACVPDSTCTIAGEYDAGPRDNLVGYLLTGDRLSWHLAKAPRPANAAPLTTVTIGSTLASVTCPSAVECFAAGAYAVPRGLRPLLLSGSGSLWVPLEAPLPAGATASGDAEVTSISCASVTSCVAVGFYTKGGASNPKYTLLWSLAG